MKLLRGAPNYSTVKKNSFTDCGMGQKASLVRGTAQKGGHSIRSGPPHNTSNSA